MPLTPEKKASLETELEVLNSAINAAYRAQSYGTSGGNSITRANVKDLIKRRTQIENILGVGVKGKSRAKELL